MVDASDAIGLAETGIGLGVSVLFAGMAMKMTKDMMDPLIEKGKKQNVYAKPKRKRSTTKKTKKRPIVKNLKKRVRY